MMRSTPERKLPQGQRLNNYHFRKPTYTCKTLAKDAKDAKSLRKTKIFAKDVNSLRKTKIFAKDVNSLRKTKSGAKDEKCCERRNNF